MIPCNESFFAKVCVLEVKKRKGFHGFSTSALNKLSVGKCLGARIT